MGAAQAENLITETQMRPYAMSWLDLVNEWVGRLPGPPLVAYFVAGSLSVTMFVVSQAWLSNEASASVTFQVFFAAQPFIAVAIAHAIRDAARRSFAAFRPLLPADEDPIAIEYRVVNAPARGVLLASLVASAAIPPAMIGIIGPGAEAQLRSLGFATGTASLVIVWLYAIVLAAAIGGFVAHLVHQLREISRLIDAVPALDLYRLEPVYAFSSTTSLAAILLTANNYLWYVAQPSLLRDPFSVLMGGLGGVLALGAFAWPLWGAHRLLVREKAQALAENGAAFRTLAREVRGQVASGELGDVARVSTAVGVLELERASLSRVPTWPWHAETLRTTLAAVLLPIAVWLGQFILRRVLGD